MYVRFITSDYLKMSSLFPVLSGFWFFLTSNLEKVGKQRAFVVGEVSDWELVYVEN